jgi:4-hydroxyacetophenone monooxygenase
MPDIPGVEAFEGPSWHTARWRHDIDLKGKRVAVIGTGASAYQVVPAILDDVASMVIFQRTPPWMLPTPAYFKEIPDAHRVLLLGLPHYARWFRFYQFWTSVVGRWHQVRVDPDFEHPVSVSAANEAFRSVLVEHLERQVADRPDLLAAAIPQYPPGAKRMLRDNGTWPAALAHPKVHLELGPIEQIDQSGIGLVDGSKHEVDVIIYATGFRASAFLTPIRVIGRAGRDLHAWWDGDARAYRGMSVPGFPNLLFLYGPNTNLVVNGSLIVFAEAEMNYALEHLRTLLTSDIHALDVTESAFETYNTSIDAENRQMAWGASNVSSWYKNELGRVSQNWPRPLIDFYEQTRSIDLADHVVVEPRRRP